MNIVVFGVLHVAVIVNLILRVFKIVDQVFYTGNYVLFNLMRVTSYAKLCLLNCCYSEPPLSWMSLVLTLG